jgi:hypothetical protein
MILFTFVCVRSDGSRPTLDVAPAVDHKAARQLAREILARHSTCDIVEVWDDEQLLFVISAQTDDDVHPPTLA